jgi:predicted nucleotidyltransferase
LTTRQKQDSTQKKDLGAALFGKSRRNVLGLLFAHPDRAFYLREIIAATGSGTGQVQRELENLTDAGLVLRERRANQVYFRANPDAPIFEELKGIVTKTFGVADVLRELLAPFAERIRVAFIYGSVARAEDTARSDIDVMIVGDVMPSELVNALHDAETRLRRPVTPTIYEEPEFRDRVHAGQHFLSQVLKSPKVFLVADEHELHRLAQSAA